MIWKSVKKYQIVSKTILIIKTHLFSLIYALSFKNDSLYNYSYIMLLKNNSI